MTWNLVASDYILVNEHPVIYLFARNEKKEKKVFKITNFKPYFYVDATEDVRNLPVEVEEVDIPAIDGKRVKKLYTKTPGDVGRLREHFSHTYEADVPFELRFLIDKGIRVGFDVVDGKLIPADPIDVLPRVCYLDIETKSEKGVPDPRNATEPILCMSAIDSYTEKLTHFKAHSLAEERQMLDAFVRYFHNHDFDMITGFNIHFDVAYLVNRLKLISNSRISPLGEEKVLKTNKLIAQVKGVEVFDLLSALRKYEFGVNRDSYELENLVEDILGIDTGEDFTDKYPLCTFENFEQLGLAELNIKHTTWEMLLDKELELIPQFEEVRRLAGCKFEQTLTTNHYADIMLLREYHGRYILPTRKKSNEEETYEGGLVTDARWGVYENVINIDFSAMYPSIVLGWNISPETLTTPSAENALHTPVGSFLKEPEGALPRLFKRLLTDREKIKERMKNVDPHSEEWKKLDQMSYAHKAIIDACYGLFGFKGFRLYNPIIASSITACGRMLIETAAEICKEFGYERLYTDTDSIFAIVPGDDPKARAEELVDAINKRLQEKFPTLHLPKIRLEAIYKKICFTPKNNDPKQPYAAKKRYVGWLIWEKDKPVDKIKVVGMPAKRSDTPRFVKQLLEELYDLLLRKGAANSQIRNYLKQRLAEVRQRSHTEYGLPVRYNKPLSAYNNKITLPAKAAESYGIEIHPSDRLFKICVKRCKVPGVKEIAIHADDPLPEDVVIDWDRQFEKGIRKKVEPLLLTIGLDWEAIIHGSRQTTFEEFKA